MTLRNVLVLTALAAEKKLRRVSSVGSHHSLNLQGHYALALSLCGGL
jgi:hypothetical protein